MISYVPIRLIIVGLDGVSPRMLHEAGPTISKSLTRLINMSLQCNWFPETWKLVNVLPIQRKNEKTIIDNYRPISLLSCVSKVMECIVFKYSFNFIREHGLFSSFQSGFILGDHKPVSPRVSYHVWSTWQKRRKWGLYFVTSVKHLNECSMKVYYIN